MNISAGGARFKVSQAIVANEVLAVTIESKRRNRKIVVSGKICWARLEVTGGLGVPFPRKSQMRY